VSVIVDSLGHMGTTTSSARYKEAIKPMDKTSEAVLALQPVTFRYRKELDPTALLSLDSWPKKLPRSIPIWWHATN
jgi:hypothetical protein